jgi:hypothetical protein
VSGYDSGKRSGKISGNMPRYGSGSDSGEASVTRSGTTRVRSQAVSDKGLVKRPGKNSGKEAGQDETYKTRIFLCFRVNPS